MTSSTQLSIRLRDRAHAYAIVRELGLDDVLQAGGSADGFKDWLFISSERFNSRYALQQALAYTKECQLMRGLGFHLDCLLVGRAEKLEVVRMRSRAKLAASVAAVEAWWSDKSIGQEVTLAAIELSLGEGAYFAASHNGSPTTGARYSWALERLLADLVALGDPDDTLDKHDWMPKASEDDFRQLVKGRAKELAKLHKNVAYGKSPTRFNVMTIAHCMIRMSHVPRVRLPLRAQALQARLREEIQAAGHSSTVVASRPSRRRCDL